MIFALLLSGGTGSRMGESVPKQYIVVNGKPIIGYSLDRFQNNSQIDAIIVVADKRWNKCIEDYCQNRHIDKLRSIAEPGISRQHSLLSGLRRIEEYGAQPEDIVLVHDAARPNLSNELIDRCILLSNDYDCVMPVLPMKDTIYLSEDGEIVTALLNRDYLYAGQAPEAVHMGSYYLATKELTDEELKEVRGTSAVAYQRGLSVGLVQGEDTNYKITTKEDFVRFRMEQEK